MSKITEQMCQDIDKLVLSRLYEAKFDKTYTAVITEVMFNNETDRSNANFERYKCLYNGLEEYVYIHDNNIHSVGEQIQITIPLNIEKNKYVSSLNARKHPVKAKYEDLEEKTEEGYNIGKITETWKNNQDAYIERIYKLIIKDKDLLTEEIVKMICSDDSFIDFEGFRTR